MHPYRVLSLLVALLCCLTPLCAQADDDTAPATIRPGHSHTFTVTVPVDCVATATLTNEQGESQRVLADLELPAGESDIIWNGLYPSGQAPAPGVYTLSVRMLDSVLAQVQVRIGSPYPQLIPTAQSAHSVPHGDSFAFSVLASEAGTLHITLQQAAGGKDILAWSHPVQQGANDLTWDCRMDGEPVEPGSYRLQLVLENAVGERADPVAIDLTLQPDLSTLDFSQLTSTLYQAHNAYVSKPYSALGDGSYWCMPPGETDDAVIWDVMMQPITVYDDGRIGSMGHVYLRENPDGTGRATAQIHGRSQGLHVIGEVNEHGYVLVEAFSNYDPDYQPLTDEEKAHAFDICQGYIEAKHLKTIEVKQDIAFLIDKLTQRMYIFRDGVRVTELLISTGLITDEKYYYETIAGEFITINHGSGYWSEGLYSDLPIRFNGGTLFHEVCCYVQGDTRYYGIFAERLGSKHSSGCVRVPYWENEEGYNMLWIYTNTERSQPYKVLIWDDLGRDDSPAVWR